jgi:hypothetical protein
MDLIDRLQEERERAAQRVARLRQQLIDAEREFSEIDSAQRVVHRLNSQPVGVTPHGPGGVKLLEKMAEAVAARPGSRLPILVAYAEEKYGTPINVKSAGNYMSELKNNGRARREGQRWFPVEKEDAPPAGANEAS